MSIRHVILALNKSIYRKRKMDDISEKNLLYIKGGVIRPENERKTSQ
jgi:hypothetical protein